LLKTGKQVLLYRNCPEVTLSAVVKFTEASSIALHTMAFLASRRDQHVTVGEIAARLPVSENHLAKVLQRLTRAGLVQGLRGPGGGFLLRGDPAEITLLQVHEAIEGRFEVSGCLFSPPKCCGNCILGDATREANEIVHARLARTRLADALHAFTSRPAPPAPGGRARESPKPRSRACKRD
jgi:Rrf2 family transcriptional regulator, nitric oxide-sensitive transcriptional repressor